MNNEKLKKKSKFLSLILRHKPEKIGLTLSKDGWANVYKLLDAMKKHGIYISRDELKYVVDNNDKKRFSFNEDGTLIRANQGHSIDVTLDFATFTPTTELYHGTSKNFLDNIRKEGLQKMKRNHVHLSSDIETAKKVGSRKGNYIVLMIDAKSMHNDGFKFFISDNGVVLTDNIPFKYISPIYKLV